MGLTGCAAGHIEDLRCGIFCIACGIYIVLTSLILSLYIKAIPVAIHTILAEIHSATQIHIGILSCPKAHARIKSSQWISKFRQSPYFGGIHVASDELDPGLGIPIAVLDWNKWKTPNNLHTMTYGQATKRLTSLLYFLEYSSAPFYLYLNDDSVVYPENLPYLVDLAKKHDEEQKSLFMLGNCMVGGGRAFLQGAAGYLMSRRTAEIVAKMGQDWLNDLPNNSEDWYFARLMDRMGLNMSNCASEFQLGQYIDFNFYDVIENGHLEKLAPCTDEWKGRSACRPFLAPFNRVAILHRLSQRRFTKGPPNIPAFPDNVMWWMRGEFPAFCRKE